MHINHQVLTVLRQTYGTATTARWTWPIGAADMARLRSSKRGWREHDVTLFIVGPHGDLATIRKPHFPPGVWRAPSGGVHPGEDFVAGVTREALEETGLQCRLERYLLHIHVDFTCGEQAEPWHSHVFVARTDDTQLAPRDTQEIAGARWLRAEELMGPVRAAMLETRRPLLLYRVALTDAAMAVWQGQPIPGGHAPLPDTQHCAKMEPL